MANVLPLKTFSLEDAFKNNPELKESDMQIIREWCQKQRHLPKIDDKLLVMFLHSNYYQLEATKNTIENFYTVRTHVPEFFSNRDPFIKEIREQLKVVATVPLKGETKEGYQIIIGAITDPDASHYLFFECTRCFFMVTELGLLEEGPTNGLDYIVDVTNLSLGHIARLNLMGIKKFLYYIQEAIPVRLKHIHILNCNTAMETLINMSKPFMKKELIQMIRFHHNVKSLEEYVSIDLLPNDMGGKCGILKDLMEMEAKKLDENREWFLKEEATMRVNESLRVGKAKSSNDLFGVEGSFKKLEID